MAHRFLYDLITPSMITPSEVAQGRVTAGTKEKSVGGADGLAGGIYTGTQELQWVVEIDGVAAGDDVGSATFRYSIDGGLTWAVGGLTTSTAPVSLMFGVTFAFAAGGSGTDCVIGDRWRFKTTLPYGSTALVTLQDRNQEWRSSNVAGNKTFDFDFGIHGRNVRACYLFDHNLSPRRDGGAQASVEVKLGPTSPASITQGQVGYYALRMGAFFAGGSYRYGRVIVTNHDNPASYLSIGKLYLGTYLQLEGRHASSLPWEGDQVRTFGNVAESNHGYRRESIETKGRVFPLSFTRLKAPAYQQLLAMRDSVWDDEVNRENRPLIFVPDHTCPWEAYLCYLTTFRPVRTHPLNNEVEIELREVVRRKTS